MTKQAAGQYDTLVLDEEFLERQRRAMSRVLVEEERHLNAIRAEVEDVGGQAGRAQGVNEASELSQLLVTRVNGESLEEQIAARIEAIEMALRRIDDGSYGLCGHCGRTIEAERLEALPEVTLCTTCKSSIHSPRWTL